MSVEYVNKVRVKPDATSMKVQAEPVNIKAAELGKLLAEMDAGDQATILLEGTIITETWWWGMQCRSIVDLLSEDERQRIAKPLDSLLEHLHENSTVNSVRPILTRIRMPECHQLVIVAGGVATWTGSIWLSYLHGDETDRRPITWPVLWWLPLLQDEDILDASERPGPPCQLVSPTGGAQ